jgi:hypothetical protein
MGHMGRIRTSGAPGMQAMTMCIGMYRVIGRGVDLYGQRRLNRAGTRTCGEVPVRTWSTLRG